MKTEGPKNFLGRPPPPYLRVWMTPPPPISRSGSGTACNHQSTAVRNSEAGTMCNTNATSAKSLNGNCILQPVLISLCTNSPSPHETSEKPFLRLFLRGGGEEGRRGGGEEGRGVCTQAKPVWMLENWKNKYCQAREKMQCRSV